MKKIFIILIMTVAPAVASADIMDESETYPVNDPLLSNDVRDMQSTQEAFIDSSPYDTSLFAVHEQGVVHKIRLREMMETTIFLPEKIEEYILGDSRTFTWIPGSDGTWGHIRNKLPGTDTNLTLIGESGAVYSFYLRVYPLHSEHVPHLTVFIENPDLPKKVTEAAKIQPKPTARPITEVADGEYLRSLPDVNVADLNYGYYMKSGNLELAPDLVFDDGKWTYFRFGNQNLDTVQRLPTIYRVVDGFDEPVNTRTVKGTIIAETVSKKGWTLRHGTSYLCVRKKK